MEEGSLGHKAGLNKAIFKAREGQGTGDRKPILLTPTRKYLFGSEGRRPCGDEGFRVETS